MTGSNIGCHVGASADMMKRGLLSMTFRHWILKRNGTLYDRPTTKDPLATAAGDP
jgi:hypothetical protein